MRLRPITYSQQKQLIPIANKPILFYAIEDVIGAGIGDDPFVMYLGDNILKEGISKHAEDFRKGYFDARIMLMEVDNPGEFGVAELSEDGNVKKQTDNFTCIKGMMKVALYDARGDSPTYRMINEFFVGEKNPVLSLRLGINTGEETRLK